MKIKEIDVRQADFAHHKTRVYIFAPSFSVAKDLTERLTTDADIRKELKMRPSFYRKNVLAAVYEKLGWTKDVQCQWSRTAGCSCGCSPGFVVKGDYGKSIFVTIAD